MVTGKRRLPGFSGDWKTKRIGEILRVGHGQSQHAVETPYGRYPIFATGGKIGQASSFVYDKPSVLIGRKGTIDKPQYVDIPFWTIDTLFYTIIRDGYSEKFIYYCFCLIDWMRYNEASGVPSLNAKTIESIAIKIPKNSEQTAIAEVLSDVDDLIVSLQKLITKKKAIKQGAMQKLLTGKRRLPGFSGEWIETNLAKKSKLKARIGWQGLTTAEYLDHGFAYLVTGTDFKIGKIDWNNCCFVDKARYEQDSNIQIKNKDLLITKDGTIGKIAYVSHLDSPATLNSGVFVVRPINASAYVSEFVYHIMNSFIFEEFLSKLAAGSTINHLYQKDFIGFTFRTPQDLKEQVAIAQVLSDMDTEIEQLEKKLSKYQKIKQGMMQELLTGRIRLIDAEAKQKRSAPAKKHNQKFDDAVMIAGIVDAFYSETYPLGRKKVQKLLYLARRKEEADVSVFQKKAAGPYADTVRYKGGEPIAKNNNYVTAQTSGKGTMFRRGANIEQALGYIQSWGKQSNIDWLVSNFQRTRVDDLELFATVDMAICDLRKIHKPVSVQTIKELIHSTKEWRDKLDKEYFSDPDIERAIDKCREFFGEQ